MVLDPDPTQIEHRIGVAKAALTDMGRPDLARRILPKEASLNGTALSWTEVSDLDDRILMFRAAAIASLSTGYDEQGLFCEPCLRAEARGDCHFVTRTDFLKGVHCAP